MNLIMDKKYLLYENYYHNRTRFFRTNFLYMKYKPIEKYGMKVNKKGKLFYFVNLYSENSIIHLFEVLFYCK